MTSTYDALRKARSRAATSMNAERASRAISLFDDGPSQEGYDLIKGMTFGELKAAAKLMMERAAIAEKLKKIGKKIGVDSSSHVRVRDVLVRAAKAGDEEAIDMLASGFLEKPM